MEEHQLKELAYTIFFGACGKRSNAEHVQVMRAQLEVRYVVLIEIPVHTEHAYLQLKQAQCCGQTMLLTMPVCYHPLLLVYVLKAACILCLCMLCR